MLEFSEEFDVTGHCLFRKQVLGHMFRIASNLLSSELAIWMLGFDKPCHPAYSLLEFSEEVDVTVLCLFRKQVLGHMFRIASNLLSRELAIWMLGFDKPCHPAYSLLEFSEEFDVTGHCLFRKQVLGHMFRTASNLLSRELAIWMLGFDKPCHPAYSLLEFSE